MTKKLDTIWECAPHTKAKHLLLKRYLDAWFPILGRYNGKVVFIDGFAGPGVYTDGEIGSPLIAMRSASSQQAFIADTEVLFLFIENDQKRLDNLAQLVANEPKPQTFKTHCLRDGFLEVLTQKLDALDNSQGKNAPIFAFIDPFGFSQVPYSVIKRLLKRDRTEAFIYFPRDHVNRFLNQADVQHHMKALFGLDEVVLPQNPEKRLDQVKQLYHDQLSKVGKFVSSFTMIDDRNHPIYDLFFVSNHVHGFVKMKEAMWAVDATGGFSFSDRTDQNQVLIFQPDPVKDVIDLIKARGKSRKNIPFEDIDKYFVEKTKYLSKHVKQALKRLEVEGAIDCLPTKKDGTPRRKGTFPSGTIVNFIP